MIQPTAGCFLVANPALDDPNFLRSVVYLVEHGDDGSLGFIVNRPLDLKLGDLWPECPQALSAATVAREGGPVEREKGLLLHRERRIGDTATLHPGLYVGGSIEDLVATWGDGADQRGPLLFLGHSGWSPGQLDHELSQGAWLVAPGSLDQVFAGDLDSLWHRLRDGGVDTGLVEPSLN